VRKALAQGKSLDQIRKEIDTKYQAEGLKSTPTPMPPAGK
jgi:hypothetical protein